MDAPPPLHPCINLYTLYIHDFLEHILICSPLLAQNPEILVCHMCSVQLEPGETAVAVTVRDN